MIFTVTLLAALALDGIFGDPGWLYHPVRAIGRISLLAERFFRTICPSPRLAGVLTLAITLLLPVFFLAATLYLAGLYSSIIQHFLAALVLYFFIAIKDLLHHSNEVFRALHPSPRLEEARRAVGCIVGRDTASLDARGVCRACVETVAENMVDGITAPLFWAVLFSLFAGLSPFDAPAMAAIGITFYKTVNTMDSMFGYKNDLYREFGWASAKLDDVVNFIPARLSGLCLVGAAFMLRRNYRDSWKIFLRDRYNHTSPNAGHSEAALAGALRIRLGGSSIYFGEVVEKPVIGDGEVSVSPSHIRETHMLILSASAIFIGLLLLLRIFFIWILIPLCL